MSSLLDKFSIKLGISIVIVSLLFYGADFLYDNKLFSSWNFISDLSGDDILLS